MMAKIPKGWETAKEQAFRLGVHKDTVHYWGRLGKVKRRCLNRRVIFYEPIAATPRKGHQKLSEAQVREIIALQPLGSRRTAKLFGVCGRTIRDIRRGRTWKHLTKGTK